MKSFMPFIIVGICIGMYFMYISPVLSDISIERAKKAEYANVLNSTKELKERRDSLTNSYNEISQENLALINKVIPDKFDPAVFANDMSGIVSKNGLSLEDFKADLAKTRSRNPAEDPNSVESYRTIATNMRVSGSYENFVRFLKDLELSLQLIDVVNLTITPIGNQKPTDIRFDYSLEINTYSLK